jgi:hypothetical protein
MKTAWIQAISRFVRTLNRDAALDSLRNILCVIGAGSVLGDFLTMRWYYVLPAFSFACAVWYVDYLRHDFSPHETALLNAENFRREIQ